MTERSTGTCRNTKSIWAPNTCPCYSGTCSTETRPSVSHQLWAQASSPRLHICMVRSSPQKSYRSSGGHATLRPLGFLAIKRTLLWDTCQLSDGYHHVEGSDYVHCHPHILNTDSAASFKTLGVIIQKIRIFMVTTVRQSNSLLIYWGSHFVPAHTPISYLHCTFFPLVNRGLVRVRSLLQKV